MKVSKFSSVRQRIFFGSDFHLSHVRDFIWKPRGFVSHVEHTNAIIDRVNKIVEADDVLFYLGDFSLNSSVEETKAYFRRLKCRNVYFIWGNHESNTGAIYKEALLSWVAANTILSSQDINFEVYPLQWENVTFLGREAFIAVDKQTIHLHHFAHELWDSMQHGVWHLCGHSHGNYPSINAEHKEGKILDVGVDNALKLEGLPVFTYEQVWSIMQKKEIVVKDHHDKHTT